MEKLWKKNLRDIEPYVPGEQSKEQNIVKINANENPYPPSPKAIEAIKNFECGKLRFYPDANATEFKQAIAEFYNVDAENVFLGNAQTMLLPFAFRHFSTVKNRLLTLILPTAFILYGAGCSTYHIKTIH